MMFNFNYLTCRIATIRRKKYFVPIDVHLNAIAQLMGVFIERLQR